MKQDELNLIKLIHKEALRGYWTDRNDCGSDFNSKECTDCKHFEACSDSAQIESYINMMQKEIDLQE